MKIWSSEHVFRHPWETVASAAIRKYPNPINPNVVAWDVLDRTVYPSGKLYTHRLMETNFGFPGWVQTLSGYDGKGLVSEHSVVDMKNKTLKLWSRNLSLANFATIDEHLCYTPHPTEKGATLLKQEAVVTIEGIPLSTKLESYMVGSFQSNCPKGRAAIEWLIEKMETPDFNVTQQNAAAAAAPVS